MVEKFDVTIPPDPTESRPRGHEFGPGSVVAPTRAWQKWAFCFWSSLGIYLKADDTAKSGAMRERCQQRADGMLGCLSSGHTRPVRRHPTAKISERKTASLSEGFAVTGAPALRNLKKTVSPH